MAISWDVGILNVQNFIAWLQPLWHRVRFPPLSKIYDICPYLLRCLTFYQYWNVAPLALQPTPCHKFFKCVPPECVNAFQLPNPFSKVLLDSKNVKDINVCNLRNRIAVVCRASFIFNNNWWKHFIRSWKSYTARSLTRCQSCECAAHNFILQFQR
jgi:hypothetical protein